MNRTEIAEWLGDKDLIALAERTETAAAAARPVSRKVKELTAQLNRARERDAQAAAAAIERGQPIPEPTETALRLELDHTAREAEALRLVAQRAQLDWETTCINSVARIRQIISERMDDATQRLPKALEELAAVLQLIGDVRRFDDWATLVDRYGDPDKTMSNHFPTSPADSVLELQLAGWQGDGARLAEDIGVRVDEFVGRLGVDPRAA